VDSVEENARVGEAGGGGRDGVVVGGAASWQALHRLVGQRVQHLPSIMYSQPYTTDPKRTLIPLNIVQSGH